MKSRMTKKSVLAVSAALAAVAFSGAAAALITDANVASQNVSDEALRGVYVRESNVTSSSIQKATVENASVRAASLHGVTVRESYLEKVSVREALVVDSRIESGSVKQASLQDVTLCRAASDSTPAAGRDCILVDGSDVLARLTADAPRKAAPGDSFNVDAWFDGGGVLTVENDPAALSAFGFDTTAAAASIESLEVWADGEQMCAIALGESCDLGDHESFSLRVNVAETGIVDGSTLGLVLSVDGHGLRTAMTTLDVMATQLAFAPDEAQAFAPFLADNVARLVIMLPTDANGNVDRDVDISLRVDTHDVNPDDGTDVLGPVQEHTYLHGDSEFLPLDETPFLYVEPHSPAAHHPQSLEFAMRDLAGIESITYGALDFHATHVVAQSPYETSVTLTASTTNANGEELEAVKEMTLAPTPEDERASPQAFGEMPPFPGRGTLHVDFVDADGNAVESGDGWVLRVQETPDSHQTEMRVAIDEGQTSVMQELAASNQLGLPWGDFVPSEYKVCVEHPGGEDCWEDGEDLVAIRTGEMTRVEIVVG